MNFDRPYYGDHSEYAFITAITNNSGGDVITLDRNLEYTHISVIETYGSKDLVMQAEVGNLTRNVVFQGKEEDSVKEQYGAHIKAHGSSLDGTLLKITQAEFRHTGQPQILGRYNIHFHMIGNAVNSIIDGIAVHDSFARVVAVHAVHNLRIQNCVGYNNQGHNIFLEDGSETGNVVDGNLIISPLSAFNMLQTDITVAGIWITHPSNYVRSNHIAGSQFYGLWYEIKERVGTTSHACPIGSEVLEVRDNVSHSNTRFGLRFFNLQPRKYPCRPVRNDLLDDPFSENPSVQTIYSGGTYYKNGESGILAEFLGNSIFEDFVLADNFRTGFQSHVTNFTAEQVIFQDSTIVGKTISNGEVINYASSAIILPRTDGFTAKNINIYNMPSNSYILESTSENQEVKLWTQGGSSSTFENIQLTDCEAAGTIHWRGGTFRNIVYDVDGSLSSPATNAPTYYTPYYTHFDQVINDNGCTKFEESDLFSNLATVQCTTVLRALKFGSMGEHDFFVGQKMKVLNLNDQSKADLFGTDNEQQEDFYESVSKKIKNPGKDCKDCYVMVLATGYVYNIHWNQGLDWSHAMLYPSYQSEPTDPRIILRLNYTEQRELFDIYTMVGGELIESITPTSDITKFIDPSTTKPTTEVSGCQLDDFHNDSSNQLLYMCVDGNLDGKSNFQQIDLNSVYCRDSCPSEGFDCPTDEIKTRLFMYDNASENQKYYTENEGFGQPLVRTPGSDEWVYGVPQEGDDVRIPCDYVVQFNLESWTFGTLVIDGTLRILEEHENIHIKATNIWVKSGRLLAGEENSTKRFSKNLTIELVGNKDSEPLVIDDISKTGTKSLAVTNEVKLYGQYPKVAYTRLLATVKQNDTKIIVNQYDIADWKVGDEVVLGANVTAGLGYEKLIIKAIVDNEIEFTTPIQNWHYGNENITIANDSKAELKIDGKYGGSLDMRCPVGNISRNIKIIGSDEDGLGGHFQIYHYIKDDESINLHIDARGSAILDGVEFSNMGQHESSNAGLHILYTNVFKEGSKSTEVQHSSFHDCFGFCINLEQADDILINENVFYNGEKFIIQALDVKQIQISKNLLIGVTLRQGGAVFEESKQWDPVALIHMYTPYLPSVDKHTVNNNIGSGSQGIGFAFPATPCIESEDNGYFNNEVGYCAYTGILFNLKENMCYHTGYASVYHNQEGITLNNNRSNDGWQAYKIISAENRLNLILHSASPNNVVHNNSLFQTFITSLARKNCVDCYSPEKVGTHLHCKNSNGIQLHVTTNNGESFPWAKNPFEYDVICNALSVFGSSLLTDVELHGIRDVYDAENYPFATECGGNRAFRNHDTAASVTAGTYLTNVKCTDCDKDGIIYLMEPKDNWRGWFGGCGNFDCTGLENMIIQDLTGDLLGYKGTIISNNEIIAYSEGFRDKCSLNTAWNAFECESTEFGVLEWSAEGDDKQKITPVPVYVSNYSWKENKINMWREWQWQGQEPLNERFNRFTSLININQVHNITYTGNQSVDILHKLQSRNNDPAGEIDRYVIVKTNYGTPLTLEVSIKSDNDRVVLPFSFQNPVDLSDHKQSCGANNYFHSDRALHFVITNERDCQVSIRQLNNISVNMRISMTVEEFFANDSKQTSFINRMAAFLEISFDKIRIVGLANNDARLLLEDATQNSSTLQFVISAGVPGSTLERYGPQNDYIKLQEFSDKIQKSIENGTAEEDFTLPIESAEYNINVLKEAGQQEDQYFTQIDLDAYNNPQNKRDIEQEDKKAQEKKDQMIAIAIGVIFGIIGVIIIAIISYQIWRKKQVKKIHASQTQEIPQIDDNSYKSQAKQPELHHHSQGSDNDLESRQQSQLQE